ncbi:MAG: hypothetical protein HYT80_09250 [Euryarchaeota archaeon]|nr:hypothetical protein [Euryarchaeota archaeon]
MPKPKLLGIEFASKAAPVKAAWEQPVATTSAADRRLFAARLKSLKTFEFRAKANPLTAGDPVTDEKWPKDLRRDYGELPNLFRFELADRWRGYYSLIGEAGGVRVWILYLWSHAEYSRQSGYAKI